MKQFLVTISAVTALSIISSGPANAQPAACSVSTPADNPALNDKVKSIYKQGVEATKRDDWATARQHFLDAWKLKKNEQIAANLGWAEFKLGMYRDAAEHLHYFLKNPPAGTPPEEQKRIQDMFEQVRKQVGALKINVNVEGATVFVDGRVIGCSPVAQTVFVEPGEHSVEARMDGYEASREVKSFQAGGPDQELKLTLEKAAAEPGSAKPPKPIDADKPNKTVIIVGAVLGGAGLIGTGIAAGFAISHDREMTRLYKLAEASNRGETNECNSPNYGQCEKKYYEAWESWSTTGNIAINAGIITGVVAAGVLTYAFWPRKSKEEPPPVQVGMHMGRDGGGAVLHGAW